MLLITCPVCTITADETEFSCGGLYAPERQRIYVRGVVRESWLCAAGCGTWFGLARHTASQRVVASWARGEEPDALTGEDA